ncbi:MAG: DUF3857 domain-containing protein [Bacteroidales bacterium]
MKIKYLELLLIVAINLSFARIATSQKAPMKWGKLSNEEIALKSCELDTSANAVVLCDYGEIWFIPGKPIEVMRHKRIKILKKAGIDEYANVSVPFYADDNMEDINNVDAQTINVDPNGKINIIKVDKKSIFEVDESKNWKTKRFSFSSVSVGSIVEYSYKLYTKYYLSPKEWNFQSEIPTLHSEYRAKIEKGLDVRYFLSGNQLQHVYGGKPTNIFALGYLKPLKEEPYCPNPDDYREKVSFQLAGYDAYKNNDPAQGIERVNLMTSWQQLAIDLMDNPNFTEYLKRKQVAREFLENNLKDLPNLGKREKVAAIHKLVSNTFRWNGKYTLNIDQNIKEFLESKNGSGAEINMFMVSLMQAAELDASPALLSTKDHGIPSPDYPFINDYNHVICHVKMYQEDMLLDATDPFRTSDLLGTDQLNPNVFVVNTNSPRLVNPKQAPVSKVQGFLAVDSISDNYLIVSARVNMDTYLAIQARKLLQRADNVLDGVKEILFPDRIDIISDSVSIENQADIMNSLRIKYKFKIEKENGGNDEFLYIKPLIGFNFPRFISETRVLPIDFYYRREYSSTFTLKIPEGYEVIEIPEQQNFTLLFKDDANFKILTKNENNIVSIKMLYKLNTTLYYPADYDAVKEFYNKINKEIDATIVLKKK